MRRESLLKILTSLKNNQISVDDAEKKLINLPFEVTDEATIDHLREVRTGFAEVIYGEFKSAEQIVHISKKILKQDQRVLITRVSQKKWEQIQKSFSGTGYSPVFHERARVVTVSNNEPERLNGQVAIICAGSADIPVLEEARVSVEFFGADVICKKDIGVAGLHRLLAVIGDINKAKICIVIAGMEGALASVTAGLTATPIIAVPTSVGYGANFQGVAPLLTMINSCASGVAVMNIDNGFGAAQLACSILKKFT